MKIGGFRESLSAGVGSSLGRRWTTKGRGRGCERKIGLGVSRDKGNAGGMHPGTAAHVIPVSGRMTWDDCRVSEGSLGCRFLPLPSHCQAPGKIF